jgi:hypothetical protein
MRARWAASCAFLTPRRFPLNLRTAAKFGLVQLRETPPAHSREAPARVTGSLAYASGWCGRRNECAGCYPNGRAIEPARNSPKECNRVQIYKTNLVTKSEARSTKFEEQGAASGVENEPPGGARRTGIRTEDGGRGVSSPDSERGRRRGFLTRLAALWHHFAPGGTKLLSRPKSFLHMHLRRAADPELGCGPGRGAAPWRL